MNIRHFIALFVCGIASTTWATDWTQYRGSNHDGSTPDNIMTTWPAEGPTKLWRAPLGDSFGSFAVAGGKVFAFIQRKVGSNDMEVAIAINGNTGKEMWSTPLGKPTYDRQGGDGPRSTPTVDGNKVYILGAYQVLSCLDTSNGKILWQHDLVKEYGGTVIKWNNAASPIMDGNLIFVNAGGKGQALLAFNKADGKVVWKGEDDLPTHSSPVPATILGVRQVVFFTQSGLVSVEPKTGKPLWRYKFSYSTSTAMSPVVYEDMVFCSAGYNMGSGVCKVSKVGAGFEAKELWRKQDALMNHWSTPVMKDGYIYGLFGFRELGRGPLKCIEMATGNEMWSEPGFGTGGATILVGNKYVLAQADQGPLVLVDANPKAYKEVARAQVLGGKCWSMPVVSDGRIYIRNTKEAACLDAAIKHAGR